MDPSPAVHPRSWYEPSKGTRNNISLCAYSCTHRFSYTNKLLNIHVYIYIYIYICASCLGTGAHEKGIAAWVCTASTSKLDKAAGILPPCVASEALAEARQPAAASRLKHSDNTLAESKAARGDVFEVQSF